MPVQRCMRETSSTDFLDWQEYIRRERNTPRREDFYAAQIAAEVRRGIAKKPQAVKTEQFLLTFTTEEKKQKPPTRKEIDLRVAHSKARWFGIVNMKPRKPPPQKRGG